MLFKGTGISAERMFDMKKIGFIGCGNMGGALALATAKTVSGEQIFLCDAFKNKAETLAGKCGAKVTEAKIIADKCAYIFLGVKPQGFEALFEEIGDTLRSRKDEFVLISMAAGVSVSNIESLLNCNASIIRIMPNTPVLSGEGMILYAANENTSEEQIEFFKTIFKAAGTLDELSEDKIDAASALSGCGPAFVYMFAEALADGAVECGLPRDKAMLYAAQTILGSAKLLLESGKHPGELKDAVCSPGGTTIAGVHALESGSFRAASMDAVKSAYQRTLQLKK